MAHQTCRSCEWVSTCKARQSCMPIEADAPVSTPEQTMTWSALAWTLTAAAALAGGVTVWANWPLFLAAVK